MTGLDDNRAPPAAIVVNGLGHLSIPLTQEQSIKLQEICSPDPGTAETAFEDPDDCPAWQLDPSKFHCSNPGK